MFGAICGAWPMPHLRPSLSASRLGLAILALLLVRIGTVAAGTILDVGQASSLGAWRVLHGLRLYGAVSWQGPGGLRIYRPDSYGPFAYYAYIPFVAVFPPALLATLLPAGCFDALTPPGPHKRTSQIPSSGSRQCCSTCPARTCCSAHAVGSGAMPPHRAWCRASITSPYTSRLTS